MGLPGAAAAADTVVVVEGDRWETDDAVPLASSPTSSGCDACLLLLGGCGVTGSPASSLARGRLAFELPEVDGPGPDVESLLLYAGLAVAKERAHCCDDTPAKRLVRAVRPCLDVDAIATQRRDESVVGLEHQFLSLCLSLSLSLSLSILLDLHAPRRRLTCDTGPQTSLGRRVSSPSHSPFPRADYRRERYSGFDFIALQSSIWVYHRQR